MKPAEYLRKIRVESGLSQKKTCRHFGKSDSWISHIELGFWTPSRETFCMLASFYGVDPEVALKEVKWPPMIVRLKPIRIRQSREMIKTEEQTPFLDFGGLQIEM